MLLYALTYTGIRANAGQRPRRPSHLTPRVQDKYPTRSRAGVFGQGIFGIVAKFSTQLLDSLRLLRDLNFNQYFDTLVSLYIVCMSLCKVDVHRMFVFSSCWTLPRYSIRLIFNRLSNLHASFCVSHHQVHPQSYEFGPGSSSELSVVGDPHLVQLGEFN